MWWFLQRCCEHAINGQLWQGYLRHSTDAAFEDPSCWHKQIRRKTGLGWWWGDGERAVERNRGESGLRGDEIDRDLFHHI